MTAEFVQSRSYSVLDITMTCKCISALMAEFFEKNYGLFLPFLICVFCFEPCFL